MSTRPSAARCRATRLACALTAALALGLLGQAPAATAGLAGPAGAPGRAPAADTGPGTGTTGPRALARLRREGGDALLRAARRNETTVARLTRLLADRQTRMSARGHVFYADAAPDTAPDAEAAAADETAGPAAAAAAVPPAYPLDQTFALHSRPGSARTIFLDFDGADVSGTWWNDPGDPTSLPDGFHAGYSQDASATFSPSELAVVQEVWTRVAEDYAPFDVDVTTADPGEAALRRTSSADPTYGTHVVITPGSQEAGTICDGRCAGVAWVDVFDRASSTAFGPAWVFTDLTSGSAWDIAEVASHEAGHTFGLKHDGTATSSYYNGRGVWGPIMGSSNYPLTQFNHGDYSGADNPEDDLAVIAAGGAPRLADDVGGDVLTALPVGDGTTASRAGLITDRDDRDVYAFSHGACTLSAAVRTTAVGPDLDARLRLLAADGSELASANPPVQLGAGYGTVTGTGASLSTPVPAGTSYLEVDGVGQGAMPTSGYSDYGSIGRYTLDLSCPSGDGTGDETGGGTDPGTGGTGGTDPGNGGTGGGTTTPGATPPGSVPGRPAIGWAYSGARGGTVTARATWRAPYSNGGSAITGYRVTALKLDAAGRVVRRITVTRPASARSWSAVLPRGAYRFVVAATNALGTGAPSLRSNRARAR